MIVAIHPDDYTNPAKPDKCDASSPRWAELLQQAGHEIRWVDVYRPDILEQIRGCHGLMWRWAHFGGMHRIAQRLLPVVERELGLPVYPDQNTCWHYDDKIAQYYLLKAADIPIPQTWIFWKYEDAAQFCRGASFPLVVKLAGGAGSENVCLVQARGEAQALLRRLFSTGLTNLRALPDWKH